MTQTNNILKHLIDKGTIEPMQALNLYGCYRLSDVILRLRKRGHVIDTEIVEYIDTDGKTRRYGVYKYIQGVNNVARVS